MFSVGRICLKTAGRDSNVKCVVVDTLDKGYVLIDGQTRRKKCNTLHLEPTTQVLKINKGASHEEVVSAFKTIGIEIAQKKPKQKTQKTVSKSAVKATTKKEVKPKAEKKTVKK